MRYVELSNREPSIIKEFRELYEYVRLMGDHINQIHSRLDNIDKNINDISSSHRNAIIENTAELKNMKENMVNKYEVDALIEKMKASVGEPLPSLPLLANKPPQVSEVSEDMDEE